MHATKLLRTADNPGGQPLGEILGRLSVELQTESMRLGTGPASATINQIVGLIIQAKGIHERAQADGCAIDSMPKPWLVPRHR